MTDRAKRRFELCRSVRLTIECGVLIWGVSIDRDLPLKAVAGSAQPAPACTFKDRFFEEEVWAKVGERTCLRSHNPNGEAAEIEFMLSPSEPAHGQDLKWIQQNCEAFPTRAAAKDEDQSLLLLKASGGVEHGGGALLKLDSLGGRPLERFNDLFLTIGIDCELRRAEGLKIREKLVVIIQGETGRTPMYNNGNGKDHWSIGSIRFLGPGIAGHRVIGATDEKQRLVPIHLKMLAIDKEQGIRVRLEHLHVALREYAGIHGHVFGEQIPLEVAASEQLRDFRK